MQTGRRYAGNMALFNLIFASAIVAHGYAQCYDSIRHRSYRAGETYSKTKRLGHLIGIYSCECRVGGMMYCTATDIPCRDVNKQFVDKDERFNTYIPGQGRKPFNCICRRGFGRYDSCDPGHMQRGTCRDIRGNVVNNNDYFITEKLSRGMRCRCRDGNAEESSCQNVCLDNNKNVFSNGQTFTYSSFGKLYTCTCSDGAPRSCRAKESVLDPCVFGRDDCDRPRATCTSSGSRYICECKPGYEGNGRSCSDIDECSGDHGCDLNAACSNTEGSYTCTCNEGYSGNGYICNAESQNSCETNAVFCDVNAWCEPTEESFACICGDGFTGSGFVCQDVDECAGDHGCDSNASCNNTEGSYMCFCEDGYSGDGRSCSQMCRDEATGMYIEQNQVFVKIQNGRESTCTCGENGEEIENSCLGEQEPEGCTDYETKELVPSGSTFTKLLRGVKHRCTCDDGQPSPESCVRKSDGPVCRRRGVTYAQDDTYELNARGTKYLCTCTQRRGRPISRCRVS